MDWKKSIEDLKVALEPYSKVYGSGDVIADALAILVVLILLHTLLLFVSMLRGGGRRKQDDPFTQQRTNRILGRLEKLEMSLNTLTTEFNRDRELKKGDKVYLEQELNALRTKVGLPELSGAQDHLKKKLID